MAIAYFEQYPDVGASYDQNNYGLTPEAYANFHFENYGRAEKRISPSVAEVAVAGAAGSGKKITPTYTPVAAAYFAQNPDVAQAYQVEDYNLTPDEFAAAHYSLYGTNEQRAEPTVVEQITRGDLTALPKYFQDNTDVAASYKLNTYGMTPEQFAAAHYKEYGWKEKRVPPTGVEVITGTSVTTTKPTTVTPTTVTPATKTTIGVTPLPNPMTGATPLPNPITGVTQAIPAGQFRELFPSFAESKRLASEMVANRPTMQNIISMIQNQTGTPTTPITTPVVTGADNPYFIQNPDVFKSYGVNTFGLNPVDFATAHYNQYGVNENRADPAIVAAIKSGNFSSLPTYFQQNKDVRDSYLTNTFGLNPVDFSEAHFNKWGKNEERTSPSGVAPTSLANVISTIAK
jgi:hypothetical protein